MPIEIISLTNKGEALSHSVCHSNDSGWKVIAFVKRLGGRTTFDKICTFVFGGDSFRAKREISFLKSKGIVTGE